MDSSKEMRKNVHLGWQQTRSARWETLEDGSKYKATKDDFRFLHMLAFVVRDEIVSGLLLTSKPWIFTIGGCKQVCIVMGTDAETTCSEVMRHHFCWNKWLTCEVSTRRESLFQISSSWFFNVLIHLCTGCCSSSLYSKTNKTFIIISLPILIKEIFFPHPKVISSF